MWHVHYMHGRGYMVFRAFDSEAKAKEFIHVNALVCALPCVSLHGPEGECPR